MRFFKREKAKPEKKRKQTKKPSKWEIKSRSPKIKGQRDFPHTTQDNPGQFTPSTCKGRLDLDECLVLQS